MKIKTGLLRSWLLIVIFSILPGLLLYQSWSPEGDSGENERFVKQHWLLNSEHDVKLLFETSREEFWVNEASLQFKRDAESLFDKIDQKKLLERCLKRMEQTGFEFSPLAFIWTVDSAGSKIDITSLSELKSSSILRQLFFQIAMHKKKGKSDLTEKKWHQRIRLLFGEMAFSEMFFPDQSDKTFPAMFNNQTGFLTWDFLEPAGGKLTSGFFLFFPSRLHKPELKPERLWKNWHRLKSRILSRYPSWPVFIRPDKNGFIHADVPVELEKKIDKARLNNFINSNFSTDLDAGFPAIGKIPSHLLGKAIYLDKMICRFCHIAPEHGAFAMLFSEIPQREKSLRIVFAGWYFKALCAIWSIFLFRIFIFKRLPELSINFQVIVWFLVIAAFPAALIIGSWNAVMQNYFDQQIFHLQRELNKAAVSVDSEISRLSQKFLISSRNAVNIPGFYQKVFRLPSEPELSKVLFKEIRESYEKDLLQPLGIVIVAQGGWCFSYFSTETQDRFQKAIKILVGSVLNNYLEQADPELYKRLIPDNGRGYGSYRVSSLAGIDGFNVYQNFIGFRNRFDNVTDFLSGESFSQQFYHQINVGDKPFAVLVAIWSPEKLYSETLRKVLPFNAVKFLKANGITPDIAVFKSSGNNLKLIEASGRFSDIENAAIFVSDKPASLITDDFTAVFVPSQKMPGKIIAVRASLEKVYQQVFREKIWQALTFFLTLISVAGGAWWVTIWISRPLQKFIPVLGSIRLGKFFDTETGMRKDEVGVMADTISKMSAWIKERENIKKFVAPQALEAIAEGSFFQAGAGTLRNVIVLVSDIRSFTTISEEHSAEQVFNMVNHHLAEMAKIVKKSEGIIDRFVGDAVWVVFYEDNSSMAAKAIHTAEAMMKKHNEIQLQRAEKGLFQVKIGAGIVRGAVLAGIMGNSAVKLDYTIAGEVLHRAEEAESASKLSRFSNIVIDESLKDEAAILGYNFSQIPGAEEYYELVSKSGNSYE